LAKTKREINALKKLGYLKQRLRSSRGLLPERKYPRLLSNYFMQKLYIILIISSF
jgi:hypothetical protein